MSIDAREVRHIAALAKLDLEPAATERLRAQLQEVLDYVAMLDELDAPGVAAALGGPGREGLPRPDETVPSLGAGEALRNAPDPAEGHFRVPKVLA